MSMGLRAGRFQPQCVCMMWREDAARVLFQPSQRVQAVFSLCYTCLL